MPDPFQPRFADLVRNYSTTQGSGNLVLGAAVSGFASFASAVQNADTFYYSVVGVDKPAEREVGRGTMQPNGSIAREPIAGQLTNFSSGTKIVALVAAAEWFERIEAAAAGTGGTSGAPAVAATRAALAALPTTGVAILSEPGREGIFAFESSNLSTMVATDTRQGVYVAPATGANGASGAWVRRFDGPYSFAWFGAVADDPQALGSVGTDNTPAMTGALAVMTARGTISQVATEVSAGTLEVGVGNYYFSDTPQLKCTLTLRGAGAFGTRATRFRVAANKDGICVNAPNTLGATNVATTKGAFGSRIEGIYFYGAGNGTTSHGVRVRTRVYVRDCMFQNFGLDGVHIAAASGATDENKGNANCCSIERVFAVGNGRHGFYFYGADANACSITGCSSTLNASSGFADHSFLGNNFFSCHAEANGHTNFVNGLGTAVVNFGGNSYQALITTDDGTSPLASTTQPGTNAAVWHSLGAGALGPVWTNGIAVQPGGSFSTSNSNNDSRIIACYHESGQAAPQTRGRTVALWGTMPATPIGPGHITTTGGDRLLFSGGLETRSGDWVAADGRIRLSGTGSVGSAAAGESWLFRNSNNGLCVLGRGDTFDHTRFNKNGSAVWSNDTGTQNVKVWGTLNAVAGFQINGVPLAGISDGDKGDVAVSSSGAAWTVEGASGTFSAAGRVTFTGNGTFAAATIYKSAADGIGIVGATGSNADLNFLTPGGAAIFAVPTGTQNSDFYGDLNLAGGATKVYKVNGVKVVGARGAAVADATDAASVITQLNALLARCRTHGLIA